MSKYTIVLNEEQRQELEEKLNSKDIVAGMNQLAESTPDVYLSSIFFHLVQLVAKSEKTDIPNVSIR